MEPRFARITLELPAIDEITVDPLQQELAAKAKRLLGYGLLEEHLRDGVATQTKESAELRTLAQTFNELDIQPFDTREVECYQQSQKQALNRKSFLSLPFYAQLFLLTNKCFEPLSKIKSDGIIFWTIMSFFGAVLLEAVAIGNGLLRNQWLPAGICAPFAFMGLSAFYCMAVSKKMDRLTLKEWGWTKMAFAECYQNKVEIPQFALDTAIRIKEKMPEADLFVEIIRSTDRMLGDPFLCIQHGGAKHYLEVWDEFRFERQTTRRV